MAKKAVFLKVSGIHPQNTIFSMAGNAGGAGSSMNAYLARTRRERLTRKALERAGRVLEWLLPRLILLELATLVILLVTR